MVKSVLENNNIKSISVNLGEVELEENLDRKQMEDLNLEFINLGLEIIDDKKSRLIEKIKNSIITIIHHQPEKIQVNLSSYLTQQLAMDYSSLSQLFSQIEGTTIEQYNIAQKIERVKELIVYDKLSIKEIAFQLGYSSVAYLSNQFKKVTGLTLTHFKALKESKRRSIADI
jgi:YesN/AraC family two-component response regulator